MLKEVEMKCLSLINAVRIVTGLAPIMGAPISPGSADSCFIIIIFMDLDKLLLDSKKSHLRH